MKEQVVTKVEIEKTNKLWKKVKLVAFATAILGMIIANQMPEDARMVVTGAFLFLAFLIYLGARIGAWWTNG
ncbi:hypothetical protein A3C87_00365 [Candidatus Kaiserbacteria bacterium RIFCSPHIGHO2_02_FULL_49_34]|uniref:Uncharacterized protein n=1 Tax=Candidatus Kaiserbacteria bacterium RIFCSPHIGHO2_02_FULL_49_34 TaxID=1798491 RepID=A0A1F6DKI6_9BACT|nr:MAG: hypothetical protein A3C87_00365 [Candidatus Kaiserbacteria bacterium RIFCSPHIGHO2_02_FULL_49_34]